MAEFFDEEPETVSSPRAKKEPIRERPAPLPEAGTTDPADPICPVLDAQLADELALLLETGLTEDMAVHALVPGISPEACARAVVRWMKHPLMLGAVTTLHGGKWHRLTPDQRISLALSKHRAQCARYLMETEFSSTTGLAFTKLSEARSVLEKFTAGEIDPSDPLAAFARTAKAVMEKAAQAQSERPRGYGPDPTDEENEVLN